MEQAAISNQKGMTLIEVLAALVLLSLLAITSFTVITTSTIWVLKAGKSTQAMTMANSIMEDIRANSNTIPAGTFILNDGTGDDSLVFFENYENPDKWGNFKAEVKITEVQYDETSANNLLEVKIKVTWQENNQNYAEELTSIVSRR